jgi:putative transposase
MHRLTVEVVHCASLNAPYDGAMPNYRRLYVPGGTYFFTVTLQDKRSRLLTEEIGKLRAAYSRVAQDWPFETVAMCVLPDHLHCVWTLPEGDDAFSTRWRLIKLNFSKSLPKSSDPAAGRRTGERGIWQRRFWEQYVRDEKDFEACVNYVHWNPVKHGLVENVEDWPHSTWRRFHSET